jgi:hypothetical protein
VILAHGKHTNAQRHERRAEQRQSRDHADLERTEADRCEINRKQHGDEAIAEVPE